MNGSKYEQTISRIMLLSRARAWFHTMLRDFPPASWEVPEFSKPHLLRWLFSLVLLGLSCALFFFGASGTASAIENNNVIVVGISTSQITTSDSNARQAGVGVAVYAIGHDVFVNDLAPKVNAGDVIGVNVVQMYNNDPFGVGWTMNTGGKYPYSALLKTEGNTAYFKCYNTTCHTGELVQLKHDSQYIITVYRIEGDPSLATLNNMSGYLNSINEFIKVVVNQQVNINDNITVVGEKINGVWNWLNTVQQSAHNDSVAVQAQLTEIINNLKNSPSNKEAQQNLNDRAEAESWNNTGSEQQDSIKNDSYEQDSQSLIASARQILTAPATNCRVTGETHGLPLAFDFCSDSRPSAFAVIMRLVASVAGLLLSFFLIRSIFREISKFQAGL